MQARVERAVVDAVRRRLRDADGARIEPLGEGDFVRAYLLDARRVVRVPKHPRALEALAREARLLRVLTGRLPLRTPRPVFHPPEGEGDVAMAVHDLLPGTELTRDLWQAIPEPRRSELPASLGAFLRALHRQDPGLGLAAGLPIVDHGEGMRVRLEWTAPAVSTPLDAELQSALHQCFARWFTGGPEGRYDPAILHADLSPGHVLVDLERGRLTGIIDWGDAIIGDPARDFIFLYEDWGLEFLERALETYAANGEIAALRSRVLLHYLADQLSWTLPQEAEGRSADFRHGVAALRRGVEDFRRSLAAG